MSQRLKRWESPRSEGRNTKGKGGSARQRQKKKQFQMLRNKLKSQSNSSKKENAASGILFFISKDFMTYPKIALLVSRHRDLLG